MRGEHTSVRVNATRLRWIIPACAGNTSDGCKGNPRIRDHPRMRGEHQFVQEHAIVGEGSSPHARGTRRSGHTCRRVQGIIPACAGNTKHGLCDYRHFWDHPRMRGEHRRAVVSASRSSGSSPHARGTPALDVPVVGTWGIIPACAGNTCFPPPRKWGRRDHPRMRGEHALLDCKPVRREGSSPHARGTLGLQVFDAVPDGIIPACAGNTVYATC